MSARRLWHVLVYSYPFRTKERDGLDVKVQTHEGEPVISTGRLRGRVG